MFVDASAIVAILTREPEADLLADLLQAARSRPISDRRVAANDREKEVLAAPAVDSGIMGAQRCDQPG